MNYQTIEFYANLKLKDILTDRFFIVNKGYIAGNCIKFVLFYKLGEFSFVLTSNDLLELTRDYKKDIHFNYKATIDTNSKEVLLNGLNEVIEKKDRIGLSLIEAVLASQYDYLPIKNI